MENQIYEDFIEKTSQKGKHKKQHSIYKITWYLQGTSQGWVKVISRPVKRLLNGFRAELGDELFQLQI